MWRGQGSLVEPIGLPPVEVVLVFGTVGEISKAASISVDHVNVAVGGEAADEGQLGAIRGPCNLGINSHLRSKAHEPGSVRLHLEAAGTPLYVPNKGEASAVR